MEPINKRDKFYRQPPLRVACRDVSATTIKSTAVRNATQHTGKLISDIKVSDIKKHPVVQQKAPRIEHELDVQPITPMVRQGPQALVIESQTTQTMVEGAKDSSRTRYFLRTRLAYTVGSMVFLLGLGAMIYGLMLNSQVETQVQALQSEEADSTGASSTTIPTSKEPENADYREEYAVAADLPRIIRISSVGVYARVLQVGVDENNVMLTPNTAYDTAWYNGSSRPGEHGAMVIDGHVLGDGGPGVFGSLEDLEEGAEISIEKGNGETVIYTVKKVETVNLNDLNMAKLLISYDQAKPGLNLITCGGNFQASENTFDSRTIVYAVEE